MSKLIVLDFETEAIMPRPQYPPKPVGFSIKQPGDRRSQYYAFGHPTKNNCSFNQAQRVLLGAWNSGLPLLFHHAKFDVDVAETHMGAKRLPWDRMHDTLYLLFLYDPYAASLSLKPSAERILKMKSSERDAVKDWILENVPEARRKPSSWGAYICRAPGDLVGRYADGDVKRTDKLYDETYAQICDRGMETAYDRERKLMPILLDNERRGVHVNLLRLEQDFKMYSAALQAADEWLRKRLKVKDLNIDADRDVAEALDRQKIVTDWVLTKRGQKSVSSKNLTNNMFHDQRVASVFGYRNKLQTCLSTFMEPWLTTARETNGVIYTNWNQVRQTHGNDNTSGARTGRLSSNPNFQNVPKNWKRAIALGYQHPAFLRTLPELPFMRKYFVPDSKSHIWCRRDYNQQELRILAHFEDGDLCANYNRDPRFDHHQQVSDLLVTAHHVLPRDSVKILNFQDIYGGGAPALALALLITVDDAKAIKKSKRALLPDLAELEEDIKSRGKAGLPIRTWGGREYFVEPAKYVEKHHRVMTFEYKLLNYLIQGSASDCTKESIIRYHEHPKAGPATGDARFLITVHDENDVSAEKKKHKEEMLLLREIMQSVEFDAPMLSDGEAGPDWGTLSALKEPVVKFAAAAAGA